MQYTRVPRAPLRILVNQNIVADYCRNWPSKFRYTKQIHENACINGNNTGFYHSVT